MSLRKQRHVRAPHAGVRLGWLRQIQLARTRWLLGEIQIGGVLPGSGSLAQMLLLLPNEH